MADPFAVHGGNLDAARVQFPEAPEPWLDLSTGINPVPFAFPRVDMATWARLPDPAEIEALEAAAARRYGAPTDACVVAAPGTQAIIQALPLLMPARCVAILGPTYAEHEGAWRAAGADVAIVPTIEGLRDCDVAIVVNPGNPLGRLIARPALLDLARELQAKGATLVVDEAFVDVLEPSASLVPELPETGVVILRSFGKAYGLAGLRLGFAVTGARDAETLRRAFGPWCVSGPAITIGRAALDDDRWIPIARRRLRQNAKELDDILLNLGMRILGGTPLFRLAKCEDAAEIFIRLAHAGILVRPFSFEPTWLRFGVPYHDAHRLRLQKALARPSEARPVRSPARLSG